MNRYTLLLMALFSLSCSAEHIDTTTVTTLELDKYLGQWYEIARFDHRFERGLTNTMAQYTLLETGKVQVINSGRKDGVLKTSVGKAKITTNPGLLRVSFFGPFYSDYRVFMISSDYQYALVGSSSSKYLWILARAPFLPQETTYTILEEMSRRGYDASRLIWVDQGINLRTYKRLCQ